MAKCRFCGREISWGLTPDGKKIPLEKMSIYFTEDPTALEIHQISDQDEFTYAKRVTMNRDGLLIARLQAHGLFRVNHWATCPNRDEAAKERDAKKLAAQGG